MSDGDYKRILGLFSRAGLSMDHELFDEEILDMGTQAILKTRDGKLRAAVPSPLGRCVFLNDVSHDEMIAALRRHKEVMKSYPRHGAGLEASVDASDTGYTMNKKSVETETNGHADGNRTNGVVKDDTLKLVNGKTNGVAAVNGSARPVAEAIKHASGPEGVDGLQMNGTH